MSDREYIIGKIDAIVEDYGSGKSGLTILLEWRRDLAVFLYRLTAHVKDVHGKAAVSYARRKYAIAKEVVEAKKQDVKAAMDLAEARAETLNVSQEHREAEAWAEAEREAFKAKIDMGKQVLSAMQQEISVLSWEERTTHYQGEHA